MSIANELSAMQRCIEELLSITADERIRVIWYLDQKVKHFNETKEEKLKAKVNRQTELSNEMSKLEAEIGALRKELEAAE